jgi:ABC-2 type transport system ATP-binding protein
MDEPLLVASGVGRRIGARIILAAVDLAIRAGEVTAIVGRNGAGKTTLLAALAGLTPHEGTIRVAGDSSRAARRRLVAYLDDDPAVYPNLATRDHLAFVAAARGRSAAEVDAVVARFGLAAVAEKPGSVLSRGERQRLALAGAVLAACPIVVLDEPTNGLDPLAQRTLEETIRTLAADGVAMIVSTHQLSTASAVADRVVVLAHGRVVARIAAHERVADDILALMAAPG